MQISENRPFWTKIRKVTAAQWSRQNRKFQFDPNNTSKDPIRGRDPKMGAKSAQERLTYTHSLCFVPKKTPPPPQRAPPISFVRYSKEPLCSPKYEKTQMDPHTPSEVPIRISDPKLGAESAHKRPRKLRNPLREVKNSANQ